MIDPVREPSTAASPADRAADAAAGRMRRSQGMTVLGLGVRLSAEETAALKAHAKQAGVPLARLVTGALIAAGLLEWTE